MADVRQLSLPYFSDCADAKPRLHHRAYSQDARERIYDAIVNTVVRIFGYDTRQRLYPRILAELGVPYSVRQLRNHMVDMAKRGMLRRHGQRGGYTLVPRPTQRRSFFIAVSSWLACYTLE